MNLDELAEEDEPPSSDDERPSSPSYFHEGDYKEKKYSHCLE
jgi:hypothetical protein